MPPIKLKAFSIIELLCVLAVIAVLLAFLLPMLGGARRQMSVMQTKARFERWIMALESFRSEYGYYPQVGSSGVSVNEVPARWLEILSGRNLTGGEISDAVAVVQNPKKIKFLDFSNSELDSQGRLLDGFDRTEILYFYDADGDGFLDELPSKRGRIGFQSVGDPTVTSY